MRSDTYQSKSAMWKTALSYSKTGTAPVWLNSKNYSSSFYLVTSSKEIDFGRKYGEQKNAC